MRNLSRKQTVLIVVLMVVALVTAPLPADAAQESCFGSYAAFTSQSWNNYEACIQETNDVVWYQKIATRQLCRVEWVSNAFQAEGNYASCMTGFSKLWQ